LLVRLAGDATDTLLLDTNPSEQYANKNFVDSFLNAESPDFTFGGVQISAMANSGTGVNVVVSRTALVAAAETQAAQKALEVMAEVSTETQADIDARAKAEYTDKGKEMPRNSAGVVVIGQTPEQVEKIKNVLADNLGEEVAEEVVKATESINYFREKHEIPPIKIDA
jgi:hypothetical protein